MHGSPNDGVTVSPRSVGKFKIISSTLSHNKRGIVLQRFTGEISIEKSNLLWSASDHVVVQTDDVKTLRIDSTSILHGGHLLHMKGTYFHLNVSVSNCVIGWLDAYGVAKIFNGRARAKMYTVVTFLSNTFISNHKYVVDLSESSYLTIWVFERNTFVNNTGPCILQSPPRLNSYYSPTVMVKNNTFITNQCGADNSVIDVRGNTHITSIQGNIFDRNIGRILFVSGTITLNQLSIIDNVFEWNDCGENGVIEVLRMEKEVKIINNILLNNKGMYVVRLQAAYRIDQQTRKEDLWFANNTLIDNHPKTSHTFSCVVNISGILAYKDLHFSENQFYNPKFLKDLCLNLLARSQEDVVKVTQNWWGSNDTSIVASRIFHFDENSDYAIADFVPFMRRKSLKSISNAEAKGWSVKKSLRGRISTSRNLTLNNSPYIVASDLTVLPGITVRIDPGVELQFSPGVSLLVLGTLIARGTSRNHVKFTVLRGKGSVNDTKVSVRLTGGEFPWVGQLNVLHNDSWAPVCIPGQISWKFQNIRVACRQLGYNEHVTEISSLVDGTTGDMGFPFELNCIGNESKLQECPMTRRQFNCSVMKVVQLRCEGTPWGNVRFVRERKMKTTIATSVLEHLEIEYCGNRHGRDVSALEIVMTSPRMNFVFINNCSSGGLTVFSPEDTVKVTNSSFGNLKKSGVKVLQTHHSVVLHDSFFFNNENGVIFMESSSDSIPTVQYGRVALCSSVTKINFTESQVTMQLLHFSVPHITGSSPTTSCHIVLGVKNGMAFKLRLLFQQGSQNIQVFSKDGAEVINTGSSYENQLWNLKKGIYLPWDSVKVVWNGYFTSQVLLSVETLNMSCKYASCLYTNSFHDPLIEFIIKKGVL